MAALVSPSAAFAALPDWNLTGAYRIDFMAGGGHYLHDMDVTVVMLNTDPGEFSGTGTYVPDTSYTWTVTGHLDGSKLDFHILYTGTDAGYWVDAVGTVAANGTLSGTAKDRNGLASDWHSILGAASPYPATTDCSKAPVGTYPGYTYAGSAFVPSFGPDPSTPPIVSMSTEAGVAYMVEASGTYYAGGASLYDVRVDAEYTQDAVQRAAGTPWTDSYLAFPDEYLELMVDGANVEWGSYSPVHVYAIPKIAGASMKFEFHINDNYTPNNTGGLCVSLFKDSLAPVVDDVVVTPASPLLNEPITITGTVDDSTTGGSLIAGAEYSIGGGSWTAMAASDGTFDETSEGVTASATASTAGSQQVCVRGTDVAGNASQGACVTLVTKYAFNGFLRPVDNPEVENVAKGGQTIPIKWQLSDANGFVSDLSIIDLRVNAPVACSALGATDGTDPIENYATGGTALRYDFTANQYVFNWKTQKWAGQCGKVTLKLPDGTSYDALFKFK